MSAYNITFFMTHGPELTKAELEDLISEMAVLAERLGFEVTNAIKAEQEADDGDEDD